MALSAAARAALEQFRHQQQGAAAPAADGVAEEEREMVDVGGGGGLANLTPRPTAAAAYSPPPTPAQSFAEPLSTGGLFRPEQPKTLKESGISYRTLESLLLKVIKQEGPQTEQQLSDILRLAVNVFAEIVKSLHKREVLDTPQPMTYDLTTKGRELVALLERDDGYVGPAPVSFEAFCAMCRDQAKRERRVTMEDMKEVFSQQSMRPELLRTLKEGFNSEGRIMLFYGPPGNGKSLITDALHGLLKHPVLLPYSFEFNGKIVQYYDPAFHSLREDLMRKEEEEAGDSYSTSGKPDRRWLISKAPLVTVGTEFKVSHFEIAFDGQYSAPPHVKANNGIFIFDDLGRQTEDHNMILNQFIYPLEQQESIVKFSGGSSMRVPFLERLFLSTNLNHEELLDDAFKRRLQYQVLVDRPTSALFKDIFQRIALKNGVDQEFAIEMSEQLVKWYKEDERVIRAVDPRNLFRMMDATLDEGERLVDKLDMKMFRRIYEQYPAAFKKDAKYFAGAMDAGGGGEDSE
jgi:predicted ATPase with chaperone activity